MPDSARNVTEYCAFCRQPTQDRSGTGFVCRWCGKANTGQFAAEPDLVNRRVAAAPHSYDELVRDVDSRTSRMVERFLAQAAAILPIPVEISQRQVKVVVGRHRGPMRILKPGREVTRIVGDKAPGYRVFSWFHDARSLEGPSDPRSQDFYVMRDGTMRLHGGYQYPQARRRGRPGQPAWSAGRTVACTAGRGQLPGFLAPNPACMGYGPLIPGLPHEISALQKTAVWLEAQLRDYLLRS